MILLCLYLVVHQVGFFDFVQMDILIGHVLGLACRPADLLIALVCWSPLPRDSNPSWGDWGRSFLVVWVSFGFCLFSGDF